MLTRLFIVLLLIWVCHQTITDDDVDVSFDNGLCRTSAKYNVTQANMGQAFFHHLIYVNDSFKDVNEHNVCSMIHFLIREATHNGQPVQFSSG
jgi:hypothetical protein